MLARSPAAGPFLILAGANDLGPLVAECLIVPLDAASAPEPRATSGTEIAATDEPPVSPSSAPLKLPVVVAVPPVVASPAGAVDDGDLLDALFEAAAPSTASTSSAASPPGVAPMMQTGPNVELALLRQKLAAVTGERDALAVDLEALRAARVEEASRPASTIWKSW